MGTKQETEEGLPTFGIEKELEFTPDELKMLRDMEGGGGAESDLLEAAEKAEGDETPEPEPKAEEPAAKEPEAKEPEPDVMSPADMTRSIRDLQRENAGLRSDLIGERRRRQAAEDLYAQRGAEPKEESPVALEMDTEGRYVAPIDKIADAVVNRLKGQGGREQQGFERAAREVGDQAEAVFQDTRAGAMREAKDPELVARAADEMREATSYLDRRVMEELPRFHQRFQNMPPGIDRIAMIVTESPIGKEMAEKYPDLDPVELADVALSRSSFRMRRALDSYAGRVRSRSAAPRQEPAAPEREEQTEARPRPGHEERPRPMARRGGRAPESREAAQTRFAGLSPNDVWSMTDEDFEEMERVATTE
jgi:hypothetical protein